MAVDSRQLCPSRVPTVLAAPSQRCISRQLGDWRIHRAEVNTICTAVGGNIWTCPSRSFSSWATGTGIGRQLRAPERAALWRQSRIYICAVRLTRVAPEIAECGSTRSWLALFSRNSESRRPVHVRNAPVDHITTIAKWYATGERRRNTRYKVETRPWMTLRLEEVQLDTRVSPTHLPGILGTDRHYSANPVYVHVRENACNGFDSRGAVPVGRVLPISLA